MAILAGLGWLAYSRGAPLLESVLYKTEVSVTRIAVVSPSEASLEWSATGYLVPQRITQVSSRVSGTVLEVRVRQGERVSKGQAILVIDSRPHEAQVAVARSRVATAGSQVLLAEKQAEAARRQIVIAQGAVAAAEARVTSARHEVAAARWRARAAWSALAEMKVPAERARRLAEKGVGDSASAEDLEARLPGLEDAARAADDDVKRAEAQVATAEVGVENARTEVAKAEADAGTAAARVDTAREEVALAQAQVDALLVDLESFTVESPIDGLLLVRPPEVGEMVGPQLAGLGNTSGAIEVADLSTLVVEADVPEARIARARPGVPCEIVLDAFPARRYRGRLRELVPRVNRAKAMVTVKVEFVDAFEGLLPDMAARVGFLTEELGAEAVAEPPRVVVPASALSRRGGAAVVFVVDGDRVRLTAVEVGEPYAGGYELLDGPPSGTKIVDRPAEALEDGQRIQEIIQR